MVKAKGQKLHDNGMESDSDSDDDYDPTKDPLAGKDEEEEQPEDIRLEEMSHARSRKAISAWEEVIKTHINELAPVNTPYHALFHWLNAERR
jgi:hypothetical protein